MELSAIQQDAIAEMANIGVSRAARQLSVLLGDEIRILPPKVRLRAASDAVRELADGETGDIACVYQTLGGDLSGRIALLLPSRDSRILIHSLIDLAAPLQSLDLRVYEYEAMTEIGNIIISSCVSAIADMLRQHITVSVPRYAETRVENLFADVEPDNEPPTLMIDAHLAAVNRGVRGVIALAFSARAAMQILEAVHRITTPDPGAPA